MVSETDRNLSFSLNKRFAIRIGIHLGDVVDSASDIYGDAANIASRIEGLAEEGGILVTRQIYDQIQNNKFELPLVGEGTKKLKNVSLPVEVFKVELPWTRKQNMAISSLSPDFNSL